MPFATELRTAAAMREALAAGEVTSVELVERSLAEAERWDGAVNAFSQLWPEEALEESRRVDATSPRERPPLAGIPLAVKDVFDLVGHETTGCCAAYRGRLAASDAQTIERVRRAGLVPIGKTNQHELSAGATSLVSACGPVGNPWDPERMPGGSSGGSGAAVAAGVVPWALGSDTGGSVRIPAALCGVFGLKPTTGSVPIDGMLPHSPSLDCPGPIAATADDLWTSWLVLDERPPRPLEVPDPSRVRLGVLDGFHRERVDEEVLAAVDGVAAAFADAGATVERVDGRGIEDARRVWARVAYPELAAAHAVLFERPDEVDPTILALLGYGRSLDRDVHEAAMRRRAGIAAWYRERIDAFDALVVATTVSAAVRSDTYEVRVAKGGSVPEDFVGYGWVTCPINLAGLPAVSLPGGRSREGMPIGVSLIGPDGGERVLCGLARRWELETGYVPSWPAAPATAER